MKKIKERGKSLWQRIKDKMPHMEVCFSKLKVKSKAGKLAFIFVPLILIGAGVGFGVGLTQGHKAPVTKVDLTNYKNRRIYLVSNDNMTIPLTVSLQKRATVGEEIRDIFNLLKTDSRANTNSIKGLIPANTKLNSLEVFNDELVLDVSKEFLDYEKSSEKNLLESLTYTFGEYPDIEMLSIYVDGERLVKMPKNNTVVPDFLEKSFGINRNVNNATDISGKKMVNVYYTKTIDEKDYLVPVSQYVDAKQSEELQLVSAISANIDPTLGLKLCSEYSYIDATQKDEDSTNINLAVNKEALVEEGVVKKSLFELVSLTLEDSYDTKAVNFYVEDEKMMVQGIVSPETYEVSSMIYNTIEL
ncbi:MAG TPA: hypothetical protein DCY93_01185 [Firmicutes bacterium]|nr:hypothetical protein [Bacillota bacterium]